MKNMVSQTKEEKEKARKRKRKNVPDFTPWWNHCRKEYIYIRSRDPKMREWKNFKSGIFSNNAYKARYFDKEVESAPSSRPLNPVIFLNICIYSKGDIWSIMAVLSSSAGNVALLVEHMGLKPTPIWFYAHPFYLVICSSLLSLFPIYQKKYYGHTKILGLLLIILW